MPVPLKVGDANQDGFPDILAIVASGTGSRRPRTPYLALSVPCEKGIAGCSSDGHGRRGWKVVRKGTDPLKNVQDARSVAFLDMDEDVSIFSDGHSDGLSSSFMSQGSLDIMVQRTGEQGQGTVLFVQNNFYYDAFFLKAIGSSCYLTKWAALSNLFSKF